MKKNILLLSMVIAMLSSCTDKESIGNADQYVGFWNYTTKGTLTLTATNLKINYPINLTGVARILQDSVYITNQKIPNKLAICPDIFAVLGTYDNKLTTLSYSNSLKESSITSLIFSGTNISGTREDGVTIQQGYPQRIFNSTYTGTKSGNTITITTTFSNYNNADKYTFSGSETTILTKSN